MSLGGTARDGNRLAQPFQTGHALTQFGDLLLQGREPLVERLWPITHSVLAVGFEEKVLGNTWWALDDSQLDELQRKVLLVWLNSTLSLLFYFGRRTVTRSAWMQMKQAGLGINAGP